MSEKQREIRELKKDLEIMHLKLDAYLERQEILTQLIMLMIKEEE